jgi:transposase-like protein
LYNANGSVITKHVSSATAKTLVGLIRKHVVPGSVMYIDEFQAYDTIAKGERYVHRIKHASVVYVRGDIHNNTVEGLWSLINRGIGGLYHSVSHDNLQSYSL